jgi:oligopeptide transport system permease protein
MARLARGQVLSYKQKEFIEAAHAMGATDSQIIFKHLMPNIIGPLIIAESLAIPGYIFLEATLSFIGLGVNPPTPSWGAMISASYAGLRSNPHLVLVPGTALTLLTLAFNFMGDGLRDAFDTRLRGR